jgi:hypothetical protein
VVSFLQGDHHVYSPDLHRPCSNQEFALQQSIQLQILEAPATVAAIPMSKVSQNAIRQMENTAKSPELVSKRGRPKAE